jgi:NAD-dependent DNA ligase
MRLLAGTTPKVTQLVALLKKARDAYYNSGSFYTATKKEVPEALLRLVAPSKGVITDAVYDALEDQLKQFDPTNPLLKQVGVAPKKQKIKLPFTMPSLDKIKGAAATEQWLDKHPGPYVVMDKIDGVSLGRTHDKAFTRGNGSLGGDISFMADALKLPIVERGVKVRGEVVMPTAKFSANWAEHYANPRNLVGGITNRNDLHEALDNCKVYAYELVAPRLKPSKALAQLKSMGFNVVPHTVVAKLSYTQLEKLLQKRRASSKYEIDGLVIAQDKVFPPSSANPDHTVAFKDAQADDSAVATVVKVEWRVTRTGYLFPRVIIKPISLKGVTVTYCSGKSAAIIKSLGVGPGAKIQIARSGDVIPDIRGVIKAVKPQLPDRSMGTWTWSGDNIKLVDDAGVSSASIEVQQTEFFFQTLGIERLKRATLQKFADAGYTTPASIMKMTKAQFVSVPGTSAKVSEGIWTQLQSAKTDVPLHILMYASGQFGRNFGSRRLEAIVNAYPKILAWPTGSRTSLVEAVDSVEGFDLLTAQQFAKRLPVFVRWLKIIPQVSWTLPKKAKVTGNKCDNQRVVLTGFRDTDLQAVIVQQGGEVIDSIKKATVLLAKDPNGTSTKLATAKQLRIPIMTVDQFRRKFSL